MATTNTLQLLSSLSTLLLLMFAQAVQAAEENCQSIPNVAGDLLVALVASAPSDSLLQLNLDENEVCTLDRTSADLNGQASTSFQINSTLDEFAAQATVEDFDTWLRIDPRYSEELLIQRSTAEGLGLTEAEFLGDNSLLEASDFFVEYVGSLGIGSYKLRNVEAHIPHFEVTFDHYQGRGPMPEMPDEAVEFVTVGTIGEGILKDLLITLDLLERRMYLSSSR